MIVRIEQALKSYLKDSRLKLNLKLNKATITPFIVQTLIISS